MTGYADMNMNTANQLCQKLQSKFYEQGYGTLADKTRARVLTDKAEKKRNMPAPRKNTRGSIQNPSREERVLDAIIKNSGRRIEVTSLDTKPNAKSYTKKTHFPLGTLFMTLVLGMVLAFVVHSSVRINEANAELADLQAGIALQNAELRELELEIETKNDLRVIEDIAVNELGMIKKENIRKEYISLYEEDEVIIEEVEQPTADATGNLLSAFSGRFEILSEYFN